MGNEQLCSFPRYSQLGARSEAPGTRTRCLFPLDRDRGAEPRARARGAARLTAAVVQPPGRPALA